MIIIWLFLCTLSADERIATPHSVCNTVLSLHKPATYSAKKPRDSLILFTICVLNRFTIFHTKEFFVGISEENTYLLF
jgi:hypothetical protein